MRDKEKRATTSDDRDGDLDPMSPEFIDILAHLLVPPSDDEADFETAADSLTEADHAALAALGTPVELVAKIVAAAKAESPSTPQAEHPTQVMPQSATATRITGRPQSPEPARSFAELLRSLRECERADSLSWSCDYHNKGIIGQGGQGVVFLTECLNEHNLPKALKVFSPAPYGDAASYNEDMKRMAHVASLVYRIQVDNLVVIERFACRNGIWMMFMRWIDGHDLAKLLQPSLLEKVHGCVDEERWEYLNEVVVTKPGTTQLRLAPGMAVNIIEKCLRALDALHSHKIVHGDIKPPNIMLDRYGSIRLVDIGSAFDLSAYPRRHTWTPQYAPPEVLKGGKWTKQSDLASLGYVLVELLSGQPVFESPTDGTVSVRTVDTARDQRLLEEKLNLPRRLDDLLPPDVRKSDHLMNLCRRLIDPDPEKRFNDAEEALEGPAGTYQFLQGLTRAGLAVHYAQEIKRWLADVEKALR